MAMKRSGNVEAPLWGSAMAVEYQTRPFTVEEYFKLVEVGILREDDRVELLDGEIVLMPPTGKDHNSVVARIIRALVMQLGERAIVLPAGSLRLSDISAPQPDFAILRPREDFYRARLARPEDVIALVEAAASSLRYDRGRKLRAYARAGIPEYWIANLSAWTIECHAQPDRAAERYAVTALAAGGDTIALAAFPDIDFSVVDLLGPKDPPRG
jgi:Uma2 family endonuclease